MTRKSWVAMTGLCVLLATSAAQAHLITICVDAYASGTEVSGAFERATLSHVTFTEAGQSSAVAWQKAHGKSVPYWSASSGPIGDCQQRTQAYSGSPGQILSEGDFIQSDSAGLTHSPWSGAFDNAGNRLGMFNPAFDQQSVAQSSAAGNISRILSAANDGHSLTPVQTSGSALGRRTVTQSSTAGNIGRTPLAGNNGHSRVDSISHGVDATTVPEPKTLALLMVGLLGIAVTTRWRRESVAKS